MHRGSSAVAARTAVTALVTVALLSLVLLVLPTPALAHSALQRSDPADGSSLDAAPTRISLVFNQPVWTDHATVVVTRGDGQRLETGAPQVVETTLSVPLRGATTGDHHVAWRVISGDGHPISGQFDFTVTAAAAPATPSRAAPAAGPEPGRDPAATSPVATPSAGDSASPAVGTPGVTVAGDGASEPATTPPGDPAPPKEGENWWIVGLVVAVLAAFGAAGALFRRRKRG